MYKIKIKAEPLSHMPLYSHLDVLVDYLIDHGNDLSKGFRWGSNKEGFFCYLEHEIDFDALITHFDLPSSIILGRDRNVIYCEKTGCLIQMLEIKESDQLDL